MKKISVVTPTYNELNNIEILINQVRDLFNDSLKNYQYEHIIIDNCSTDGTIKVLKELSAKDRRIKVILNSRNFGHIRSPAYAMKLATGDAVISLVADLQDPPALIPEFIKIWEQGEHKMVLGVKRSSEESQLFFLVRIIYYEIITKIADIDLIKNFTGFGLYDKKVIEVIRTIDDPYPYWRGLICDVGFSKFQYPYDQPVRKRGFTKNNIFTLYDIGILGITTHSKIPIRFCTLIGFFSILTCLLLASITLIFRNSFYFNISWTEISIFFFSSVQLLAIGILGEYIGNIQTQVLKRPIVVESERINFNSELS